ncbi:MAG: DUF4838 domain-containing protein [Lentisphaeria bacterium]|nr:DUF4838 domain-containing protein [Lentisphaeria bacterium]
MQKKVLSLLLALSASLLVSASEFHLVVDGKPNGRIQGNPDPTACEFRAVTELQDAIEKISKAKLPRTTMPGPVFRVYRNEGLDKVELMCVTLANGRRLLPEKALKKLEEAESSDAFCIISEDSPKTGKAIFIAGKTPVAVLYGAYAFIEDYLGVRFFHASEDGTYYPTNKNIVLNDIDDFRAPWLKYRRMSCWSGSVAPVPMEKMEVWLTRRAYQWGINHNYNNLSRARLDHASTGSTPIRGGGHLTFEIAVPKALFKTHPEYFPLQKGKRVCQERSQRCLTHPDVRKRVADCIVRYVAYGCTFTLNFHDSTNGWCECENCRKYGTDKDGKFSLSNYANRFVKEISEEVYAKAPEAVMNFLSYSDYRELPTIPLKFDKRLLNTFCPHQRCYVHSMADEKAECNKHFRELFFAWKKLCPQMGIFDYYAYSQSPYCPFEYTLGKDMKFYRDQGLVSFLEDCTNKALPIPDSNWQFYYLLSKLMWNADLDVEKELESVYTLYYGKAAGPMKKYHAFRRELWESIPGHAMYGGGKRYANCLLVPGAEKRLLSFLAEAEKLAGKDKTLLSRIARDRKYLTEFWIKDASAIRKAEAGVKTLRLTRAETPVKIDGIADEAAWRKAELVTNFRNYKTKADPREATKVKILYDEKNLYLYFECMMEHAWSKPVAHIRERDGQVWTDDSMEVFVMPPDGDYYHFVFNTLGTLYDAKVRSASFDYKGDLAVKVYKDRYTAELRIPLESLNVKKLESGQTWKFHFFRNCRNLQPPASSEGTGLDGVPPHEITGFRKAVAGESVVRNGDFSRTAEKKGVVFAWNWGYHLADFVPAKEGNSIRVRDVIYTYLSYPYLDEKVRFSGSVTASGKGKLTASLSGCVRQKGDKKGFGHEIKMEIATFELTDTPQSFPLSVEVPARSQFYLYLRVKGGEAKISHVSLSR